MDKIYLDFVGWKVSSHKETKNLDHILLLERVLSRDRALRDIQTLDGGPEMLDGQWICQHLDTWSSSWSSHPCQLPLLGQCHQDSQIQVTKHQKFCSLLLNAEALQAGQSCGNAGSNIWHSFYSASHATYQRNLA